MKLPVTVVIVIVLIHQDCPATASRATLLTYSLIPRSSLVRGLHPFMYHVNKLSITTLLLGRKILYCNYEVYSYYYSHSYYDTYYRKRKKQV